MKVSFVPSIGIKPVCALKNKGVHCSERLDSFEKENKEVKQKKKESFLRKLKSVMIAVLSSLVTALAVMSIEKKKNNKLQEQLDNVVLPQNFRDEVNKKVDELKSKELTYSPITPKIIVDESDYSRNRNPVIVMPKEYKKTRNREDARVLEYPEFQENQACSFEFPMSNEVKITYDNTEVKPIERTLTTISESYADSLVWDDDKIARDLLQNFYDGHGQTLDGVKFDVTPSGNGKYTVRIQGKSTYSPDKAILLGESSKKNDSRAAGNYGEGLKMVVLKLLKEKGAENVDISSGNWNVNWQLLDSGLGKKVLAYELDEVPKIDGNYIQFDTDNVDFIKSIINSFDRFYHYNNPAFTCPDFENDVLSVKLIPEEQVGKFYIAGQAFEVDGKYENLNGMSICIKNKPPLKHRGYYIFDPSRDRTSLTTDNMRALGNWIVSKGNMSKNDVVKLLHSLKEYWDIGTMHSILNHNTLGTAFIAGIFEGAYDRGDLNIKFPDEKDVADSFRVSNDLADMYKKAGYNVCSSYFKKMGMRSIEELVDETRQHKPLEPTEKEKNKIIILKEAIQLLAPVLSQNSLFTKEELDSKIYIYDRKSEKEDAAYNNVAGEAIVDKGKSYGFWLDRTYLKEKDFSTLLSTSLHELTHKFGGDESSMFSYKLTDVMQKVFEAINENPNLAIKLKVLEEAWKTQS